MTSCVSRLYFPSVQVDPLRTIVFVTFGCFKSGAYLKAKLDPELDGSASCSNNGSDGHRKQVASCMVLRDQEAPPVIFSSNSSNAYRESFLKNFIRASSVKK